MSTHGRLLLVHCRLHLTQAAAHAHMQSMQSHVQAVASSLGGDEVAGCGRVSSTGSLLRLEVPAREEDVDDEGLVDVELQIANLLEVVDTVHKGGG
jgi:hypothetical protein